jgi:serine/threonine protein kinase/Tol biopolymer transport system component
MNRSIRPLDRTALQDAAGLVAASEPELLHAGDMIATRYRIIRRIGAGGMGMVYQAEDLRLGRLLAVKVVPAGAQMRGGPSESVTRFQREARAASQLNHPNIVAIHDSGTERGLLFIAMELVEGRTLRSLISEGNLPDPKTVLDVISQTSSALAAVHGAGIVHRDIKPENIMVRPDGFVKVLDFGLARMRDPESNESITTFATRTGQVIGTVQYLSPEQVLGKRITAQTDIFSLGVAAYEYATGIRPFDGPTDGAVFDAIVRRDPPPPSAARPGLSAEFDALIMSAIEKDTDLRFQTIADFRSACRRAERALGAGAKERTPSAPGPVWVLPLRRRSLGILVASVAAIAFLLFQNRPFPDPKVINNIQITAGEPVNAFVNDGGRFYYSAGNQDVNTAFLEVSTTGGAAQEISSLRGMLPLDISADKSEILLGKFDSPGPYPLWTASVLGSAPRRIGNLAGNWARWSSRGDKIVFAASRTLSIAAADGSNVRTLFTLKVNGQITAPFFLDADTKVRFHLDRDAEHSIWQINTDGSGFVRLWPDWRETSLQRNANISADGRFSLIVAGTDGLSWDLWSVREQGRLFGFRRPQPVRLTAGPLTVSQPQFAPSGRRIFYVGRSLRVVLARFDSASQTWKPYFRGMNAYQLEYSRDGQWMTYVAPPGHSVWRSRADGSQAIQLSAFPLMATNPRLSPDNSKVVFWGNSKGQVPGMYLVSASGGVVEILSGKGQSADREEEPTWSPDGRSVLYGKHGRLWTMDIETRAAVPLPNSEGLLFPRWSWDGKYAATADAHSHLWLYDLVAHSRVLLTAVGSGYPTWSRDNKFIYFENDGCSVLYRVNVATREVETVATLTGLQMPEAALGWFGLTPDGNPISATELSSEQIYAMDWDPR